MTFVPPSSQASVIVAAAKSRARQGSQSPSAAFDDTQLYIALNDINEWFCYWTFEPQQSGMMPFQFLRRETLFSSKAGTTLDGAIAAGANALSLASAASFTETPSTTEPQGLYIKNGEGHYDFVTFEARTGVAVSELATVDIAHSDDEQVEKIYPLPTNYGRPRTLKLSESQHLTWLDSEFEGVPPPGYFHTRFLPSKTLAAQSSGKLFLVLPEGIQEHTMTLYYVKKPNTIVDGNSYTDAPNGIARWAMIYKLMEYIWDTRGEDQKAEKFKREANEKMKHFAATQTTVDVSPIQGPIFDRDSDEV